MESEKRALLAIALAFIFLMAYQYLLSRYYRKGETPPSPPPAAESKKEPSAIPEPVKPSTPPAISPSRAAVTERREGPVVRLKTPLYQALVDVTTGGLRSFRLQHYLTELPPDGVPVELIDENVDPLPLSVFLLEKQKVLMPESFNISRLRKAGRDEEWPSSFTAWARAGEFILLETWTLRQGTYVVDLTTTIINISNRTRNVALEVFLSRSLRGRKSYHEFKGLMALERKKLIKVKLKKLGEVQSFGEGLQWIGFSDKYFLIALIPQEAHGLAAKAKATEGIGQAFVYYPESVLPPGGKVSFTTSAYLGPKKEEDLKAAGGGLIESLELGILTGPMLKLLKLFYRFTGNYGLAIIILSLLVKIAFWPLSHISYRSMKKMKEIQPVLEELKKKYGDDKEKLAMETMEIYRRYKVNPFSGCLPLIIQLPVFIALYRALLNAIELRHAPFVLWIKDLSSPDLLFTLNLHVFVLPVRLLPILMGVTMYAQQRLTPTGGQDPLQSRIMNYMSLIFTVLFWNFPSGLMIYWVLQNVLSLLQQLYVMRSS